jgi:hypothetical protein
VVVHLRHVRQQLSGTLARGAAGHSSGAFGAELLLPAGWFAEADLSVFDPPDVATARSPGVVS